MHNHVSSSQVVRNFSRRDKTCEYKPFLKPYGRDRMFYCLSQYTVTYK